MPLRTWGYVLGAAVLYCLLAFLGRKLAIPSQAVPISVFWPPSGVALGALLLAHRLDFRVRFAAVLAAEVLWHLVVRDRLAIALPCIAANLVELLGTALLVERFLGPEPSLRRTRDVVGLIALSTLGCAAGGLIQALNATITGANVPFLRAFRTFLVGNEMGIVLLTPLILAWAKSPGPRSPAGAKPRVVEALALGVLLLCAVELVFGRPGGGPAQIPLMYLVFPLILWAALRFGPRGVTAASLFVALHAIINAVVDRGPRFFGATGSLATAHWLQIYLAVIVLSGILLAAIWCERTDTMASLTASEETLRRTLEALEERVVERTKELAAANLDLGAARDELDERVRVRTEELSRTNAALFAEVEERRRAEEVISAQARAILEMSTPIVKIRRGVELVPLVGAFDAKRAEQLTARLLERVAREGSSAVLLDVTGVPEMDAETAHHLLRTIAAVRLLGAEAVLTGVRASIARTLVELGIDLAGIETQSTLAAGLRHILRKEERAAAEGAPRRPAR